MELLSVPEEFYTVLFRIIEDVPPQLNRTKGNITAINDTLIHHGIEMTQYQMEEKNDMQSVDAFKYSLLILTPVYFSSLKCRRLSKT